MLPGRDINKHNKKIDIIVKKKNGVVLKYYTDCKTKLEIKCSENHIFEIKPHKLYDNQWCSKCRKSISEEFTRFIFEKIFNKPFGSTRFDYGGHNLELDGYNNKLKIAFEYNGLHHYKKNGFVRTDEELEYRKYLDSLKVDYCKINKIKLIIIPYTVKHNNILNFVIDKFKIKENIVINYNDFSSNYSHTRNIKEKLIKYANNKNGKILEFGSDFVKLECENNHTWILNNSLLKQGVWCKKCYLDSYKKKNYKIDKNELYSIILKYCSKLNVSLVTTKNKINKKLFKIKCKNNHTTEISYSKLLTTYFSNKIDEICNRKICKKCLYGRQNKFLELFNNNNIISIGNYKNRYSNISWKFSCGHTQIDKAKNIIGRINRNNNKCNKCNNEK